MRAAPSRQVYNGLDAMVTLEVYEAISRLTQQTPDAYGFNLAIQAPALDMMLRGFRVDPSVRFELSHSLRKKVDRLKFVLNALSHSVWDKNLNANSPAQLKDFFYKVMNIPEQTVYDKGKRRVSVNRECLEKIEEYFYAMPIVATILSIRETEKQLQVVDKEIDRDLRWRTSYNIAGTETGRFSSSSSAFGTGSNVQNIAPSMRRMFVADEGYKLCSIDLEQTEARDVGFLQGVLCNDWTYLDACEQGDLHVTTSKLIWPGSGWSSDPASDREIADRIFYRDFSYRDMSKRGGHLTNYWGTPFTAARTLKVPQPIMTAFRAAYLSAYPAFEEWWSYVEREIQTTGKLTTPFGFTRQFFGRTTDDSTKREAIAFVPQSTTAHRMNLGLWRIWRYMSERVQILAQIHDAVIFQYLPKDEDSVIREALEHVKVPLTAPNGRVMIVKGEAQIGWNWGKRHKDDKPFSKTNVKNEHGLIKWNPGKKDLRTAPAHDLLDAVG